MIKKIALLSLFAAFGKLASGQHNERLEPQLQKGKKRTK